MNELNEWLLKAQNHNDEDFLDSLQKQHFSSALNEITKDVEVLDKHQHVWKLKGSSLIHQYNKLTDCENDEEIVVISSEEIEEEFHGWLDKSGNGYGKLIRRNTHNGLEDIILNGKLERGKLEGKVREVIPDRSYCDTFYSGGLRHGFFRRFRQDKKFEEIGIFCHGRRSASVYLKRCDGDSFIFGSLPLTETNLQNNVPGTHLRTCIYMYPDLKSAVVGRFLLRQNHKGKDLSGHLVGGHFGRLERVQNRFGIPFPEIEIVSQTEIKFDPSTESRISHTPLLEDPYELETVSVGPSGIPFAGEGLFSKRSMDANQLVCLFNGLRCNKDHQPRRISADDEQWSDYRLNLDKSTDLDIPLDFIYLDQYKATLGHKACHSFPLKNSKFKEFYHPRFGNIMSIVTTRSINPGEEILVNYNYAISLAPEWYRKLWFQHLRVDKKWSEKQIEDWISKEVSRWGYSLSSH